MSIVPHTKGALGFAQYLPSDQKLYTTEQVCHDKCYFYIVQLFPLIRPCSGIEMLFVVIHERTEVYTFIFFLLIDSCLTGYA